MVTSREEAARKAEASTSNSPGTCQLWTRTVYGAPSAGDQDHDGDADAVDGWLSEPLGACHPGDRNPPRGVPVAYGGGSHGFGHRAISLGGGKIRSTDAAGSGKVATVDLSWPEQHWGLHYLGWSETIDGQRIPDDAPPKSVKPTKHVGDYSTARPDPKTLVAAGLEGVMRYISPPGGIPKDLTRSEAAKLHAAGLWIALVWESSAGRAGQGEAAGRADAVAAEAAADALGYPADACIFYAVDYDATAAQVAPYFKGLHAARKRPAGTYGGVNVIDAKLTPHGWQTQAWSEGVVSKVAVMVQQTTSTLKLPPGVDDNLVVKPRRFRAWRPEDAPVPTPPPAPHPHHKQKSARRVGTLNIKGFPRMSTVYVEEDAARLVTLVSLAGLQEIDPSFPDYTATIRNLPGFDADHLDTEDPIIWATDRWKRIDGAKQMTHAGKAKVSPNRYVTWTLLEQLSDGAQVAVVNTHMVSKAFWSARHGVKPTSYGWRRAMWKRHVEVQSQVVADLVGQGHTVLLTGDFNHRGVPSFHADQVTIVNGTLDGIAYVPAAAGSKITVRKGEIVKGGWHTDHDLERAWIKVSA